MFVNCYNLHVTLVQFQHYSADGRTLCVVFIIVNYVFYHLLSASVKTVSDVVIIVIKHILNLNYNLTYNPNLLKFTYNVAKSAVVKFENYLQTAAVVYKLSCFIMAYFVLPHPV